MSVNVLTLPADERQRPHDKHDDVYQTQSSAASLKDVEMLTRTHTHFIQASDANMSRDKVSVKQRVQHSKRVKAAMLLHQMLTYLQWGCCLAPLGGATVAHLPPSRHAPCSILSHKPSVWPLIFFSSSLSSRSTLSSARVQTSSASPLYDWSFPTNVPLT